MGGSSWLAHNARTKNIDSWNHALSALTTGIRQLGLSGWKVEECNAIESEIHAWKQMGVSDREGAFCFTHNSFIYLLLIGLT